MRAVQRSWPFVCLSVICKNILRFIKLGDNRIGFHGNRLKFISRIGQFNSIFFKNEEQKNETSLEQVETPNGTRLNNGVFLFPSLLFICSWIGFTEAVSFRAGTADNQQYSTNLFPPVPCS